MHILFVNDQISFGGVPRMIQSMCFALDAKGVQTSVLTYYKRKSPPIELPESTKLYTIDANSRFDFRAYLRLSNFLNAIKPDVIHDNFGGFWSLFLMLFNKNPKILHYHNEFRAITQSPDKDRSLRDKIFIRYLLPRYHAVVSVSNHNKQQLNSANLKEERNLVIHNFVRVNSKKTHKPNSTKTIGFLGRVVFEKGADTFLELFDHFLESSGINGIIIGDGDERFMTDLQSQVVNKNLPIEFTGYVEDVFSQLERIDILVFLSRQEPFGLVLLEAINFGVPVVGVYPENGGGPWEILSEKNSGLYIERDAKKLAEEVVQLLGNDEIRTELWKRQKRMIARFSEDSAIKKWFELYSSLVK